MNKILKYFVTFFSLIIIFLGTEVTYLGFQNIHEEEKNIFVKSIGLPDLSISTEVRYIRHRSLSDIFSIFNEDPVSFSHYLTTFVYAPSNIVNITPNTIKVH